MENQHRKITGYRELNADEILLMNRIKGYASEVGGLIGALETGLIGKYVDKRWLAIAKTDLQKGFMSFVRAVAKPESF